MKPLLLLLMSLALTGSAQADAWLPGQQPPHLKHRPASGANPRGPIALDPRFQPKFIDGDGVRYSPHDLEAGFRPAPPVPPGYMRYGGGIAQAWHGAPENFVAPIGPIAYVLAHSTNNPRPPEPPGPPQPPGPPGPPQPPQPPEPPGPPGPPGPPQPPQPPQPPGPPRPGVPGPLGILGAAAAWRVSRTLRRRVRGQ